MGGLSLNSLPFESFSVSVSGLKFNVPAIDNATTRSGEVTNEWVAGFASLRPVKLRLYDDKIELASPFFTSVLAHWHLIQSQRLMGVYGVY